MKIENHKLNWADIWVLRAIGISANSGEIDLVEIIAIADGINHAILTPEEFNNAVYRLKEHSLIKQNRKNLDLTNKATALLKKHENKSTNKQGELIEKELNVVSYSPEYNPNILEVPEEFVSKSIFNDAIEKYQRKYGF